MQYAEENKESDNLEYFTYAISNYILKNGLTNAFNFEMTEEQKEEATYKNIYGKNINQLVKEGKELMKENNMTVDKYKEDLKDLSNSVNEVNQSISDVGGR